MLYRNHGSAPQGTRQRLARYAAILNPPRKYPVWSIRSAAALLSAVGIITALVAGFIPNLNVFARIELTVVVCAIVLFCFMSLGLYRGARVKRKHLPSLSYTPSFTAEQAGENVSSAADFTTDIPIHDHVGCLGIIAGFAIWLVLLLFGGIIIWSFFQLGGWAVVGFFFGLCWVMYRALRQVFARSRQCQGRLPASVGWSALYTLFYTGWLFALLQLGEWLSQRHA